MRHRYDALFARIRKETNAHWSGKYRPALTGQGIYPRPLQTPLPGWIGGATDIVERRHLSLRTYFSRSLLERVVARSSFER
jgi:hypothetical protein